MDKPIHYKKKLKIVDYKSSKYKFRGEELTSNIQAMAYSLAAKKIWPNHIFLVAIMCFDWNCRPASLIN